MGAPAASLMQRTLRNSPVHIFALGFASAFGLSCIARSLSSSSIIASQLSSGTVGRWRAEDAKFLGSATGDGPPPRIDGYKYKTNEYQETYDKSWLDGGYPKQSCWGCRFAPQVITKLPFHTVLDAGTGNGALVRLLREHGKSAWGIELSEAALKSECPDLLAKKYVEAGVLTNLPYSDNSFDLVFSSDVLEHIQEQEAEKVISELVRVSRRHLFLSISLKPHTKASADNNTEANRHTMLRPRTWWEAAFKRHGADVNQEMLWAMQEHSTRFTAADKEDCREAGSEQQGGKYEVCVVNSTWLVGQPNQGNVRKDRCITNDELEPWFFSFRKRR